MNSFINNNKGNNFLNFKAQNALRVLVLGFFVLGFANFGNTQASVASKLINALAKNADKPSDAVKGLKKASKTGSLFSKILGKKTTSTSIRPEVAAKKAISILMAKGFSLTDATFTDSKNFNRLLYSIDALGRSGNNKSNSGFAKAYESTKNLVQAKINSGSRFTEQEQMDLVSGALYMIATRNSGSAKGITPAATDLNSLATAAFNRYTAKINQLNPAMAKELRDGFAKGDDISIINKELLKSVKSGDKIFSKAEALSSVGDNEDTLTLGMLNVLLKNPASRGVLQKLADKIESATTTDELNRLLQQAHKYANNADLQRQIPVDVFADSPFLADLKNLTKFCKNNSLFCKNKELMKMLVFTEDLDTTLAQIGKFNAEKQKILAQVNEYSGGLTSSSLRSIKASTVEDANDALGKILKNKIVSNPYESSTRNHGSVAQRNEFLATAIANSGSENILALKQVVKALDSLDASETIKADLKLIAIKEGKDAFNETLAKFQDLNKLRKQDQGQDSEFRLLERIIENHDPQTMTAKSFNASLDFALGLAKGVDTEDGKAALANLEALMNQFPTAKSFDAFVDDLQLKLVNGHPDAVALRNSAKNNESLNKFLNDIEEGGTERVCGTCPGNPLCKL